MNKIKQKSKIMTFICAFLPFIAYVAAVALSFLHNTEDIDFGVVGLFAIIAIFVVIIDAKAFKGYQNQYTQKMFKKAPAFFAAILSAIPAAVAFLSEQTAENPFHFLEMDPIANFNIETIIFVALAVLSIVGMIYLIIPKKLKITTKEVFKDPAKQKLDVDTIYSLEKIKRVKQLKAMGAISEKEYDDSVARFSRGA